MGETPWILPEPAAPPRDEGPTLTSGQVVSWRERGFAFVDGVFPDALIAQAREDAWQAFADTIGEGHDDFGSGGRMEFPSASAAANTLTLHPRLLTAVAQLLDADVADLRLTQSDLWPKIGRTSASGHARDNRDQRIHVDYPNHTLLHPPRWETPEAVEAILYLSDVEECGGATAVVPREGPADPAYPWPIVGTPGVGALVWVNDRDRAEEYLRTESPETARWRAETLYPRERPVRYRIGSLLLYRHDTWHRGTPMIPGALRLVQNLTFRKAASEWIGVLQPGWAWAMYRETQVMEKIIATASVEQRCVLGFPPPGHAFWTPDTLAAVEARYGPLGMDLAPYRS